MLIQVLRLADERRAEELYSQGLLLKTEYPVNRSHLEIDKAKLDEYDPFSKDLVLPEDLMAVNEKARDVHMRKSSRQGPRRGVLEAVAAIHA